MSFDPLYYVVLAVASYLAVCLLIARAVGVGSVPDPDPPWVAPQLTVRPSRRVIQLLATTPGASHARLYRNDPRDCRPCS